MKTIINGKMYNTETAKKLMTWDNGYGVSDLAYCEETLYRKKNGEYFLYGNGNAGSKYAKSIPSSSCYGPGEGFKLLTESEARHLVEKNADVEDYIRIFGEPEE